MSRGRMAILAGGAIVLGLVAGVALAGLPTTGGPGAAVAARGTPPPSGEAAQQPIGSGLPAPTPSPTPSPVLVPDPLDGLPVSPADAARHPIAVMVDDHPDARPQSGFSSASIVWQAPAEGGIPRYMLVFSEGDPSAVGPVRSAREYFIEWAAEWRALYVHVGGSPQALGTLSAKGFGQLVYNADEFRFGGGRYLWRIHERVAPHNVYTDGKHLRDLAKFLGATSPPQAAWLFSAPAPLAVRPSGGRIEIDYPWNRISYRYDRASDTYLRSTGGTPQIDAATNRRVAPTNVVILEMHFGPLNDGHPKKGRLEAQDVGSGKAWVATNGTTIVATWRKDSATSPTLLFDLSGNQIVLTRGQTFVQVIPYGTGLVIRDGSIGGPKRQ